MNSAERFTGREADYAAARPSYPDAVLDVLFAGLGDPRDAVVADLGAGTGISARLLASRGALVYAVEPNASMRRAAEADARVRWVDGSAEATTLDEAAVDLAGAFQAFHWFDHPRALREIVRIVRPGGRAAVVYNERDETDPFTGGYGEIVRRYQTDDTERRREDGVATFAAFEGWHGGAKRVELRNAHVLDAHGVSARARSTSYLPATGFDADELQAALRALVQRHARDGVVTMALRTIVVYGDLGADGG